MDLTKRTDLLVFLLILILAGLFGYHGLYQSGLNNINSIKAQIEEEKRKNEILVEIGRLDEQIQKYENRTFATPEITPLLDKISALTKKLDLAIETFNPQNPVYKTQYIELPIKVPLRCDYHELGQLLSLIENSEEFIWVKELKMQKPTVVDPKEKRAPQIELTLSGICLKK
ncbi:MAG: type 4a pilus biogenesis protein PilO [Candidatus Omnitrophica bacterium]|nr:type 4a pilus biogenesis protein PilO [Candidatus Omnitrophota bacterium]